MKRGRGQPTKLTPKLQHDVCAALEKGVTVKAAAAHVGTCEGSVHAWRLRGERELERLADDPNARPIRREEKFVKFSEAMAQARDRSEYNLVELINNAAPKDWRAAAFLLERRHRKAYGKHTAVELTGADRGPIQIQPLDVLTQQIAALSDEELEKQIAQVDANLAALENIEDAQIVEEDDADLKI